MCEQPLDLKERAARPRGPVTFVDELLVAATNARIYSAGHPRAQASMRALEEGLQALSRELGGKPLMLGAADGVLFFRRRPLLGATLSARRLIEALEELEAGGLAFDASTSREDLAALVAILGTGCRGLASFPAANEALAANGCSTIQFLPPYEDAVGIWSEDSDPDTIGVESGERAIETKLDLDVAKQLYQDVVYVLQDAMVTACKGESPNTDEAEHFVVSILDQLNRDTQSMMRLARYERYDAFTFGHSIRVSFLALNFARHLTKDETLLRRIGLAALMHDIGKSWVPFEVLHSTGRLSPEELDEMSRHTVYGAQILLGSPSADPLSVAVAFSHHHRHAGGGYPDTIRNSRQSMATMIVKLSDVFEALTAVRPYKPRMSPGRAYRIMMSMEGHFEPSLLRKFMAVNGLYPVGSRVRLEDGRLARVDAQSSDFTRPVVVTEHDAEGDALFEEDVARIDLSEQGGRRHARIQEILLDAEL